jgi:hypothetical protein
MAAIALALGIRNSLVPAPVAAEAAEEFPVPLSDEMEVTT